MTNRTAASGTGVGGGAGVAWYLAIALLIFATALLGIELTHNTGRVATIWIANGVLLCFVLSAIEAKRPLHEVLAILGVGFAGNLAADMVSGDGIHMALALSIANSVEVAICAAILTRSGLALDFTRPKLLMVFCVVAFGPAAIASGLIASSYLAVADGADFIEVFSTWYPADALGLIIVTPPLMVLRREDPRRLLQVAALTKLAGGIAIVVGTLLLVFGQSQFPLLFLVFPAILVATFWSGFTGASLAILMTAVVAEVATFNGSGPLQLIPGDHREAIVVLQVFVAAATLQNLTVAAVLSERRRLEESLRYAKVVAELSEEELVATAKKLEGALAEAEKASEAKSDFLASMSHEMRTPLNSILGFTGIVLEDGDLSPQSDRQISLAHKAAQSLLAVVNDILDFSKIEAGQVSISPRPFSPAMLVSSVTSIVRFNAEGKGLEFDVELDPGLPAWLLGDDVRIHQILLNLLNNAIKFTQYGSVELKVEHHGTSEAGEKVRFLVKDTGIGIAPSKQHLLFKRFSQVDQGNQRRFEGTGLGLAICKSLVGLLGGELGMDSQEGRGSSFWFTLTLPRTDAPVMDEALPQGGKATRPLRILLVEDLPMNQEVAETMLRRAGHTVDIADNGLKAIAAAEADAYDLILMDIQMPGMDGVTAMKQIRKLGGWRKNAPIVALTANVLPEQVARFTRAGFNDHLGKPFSRPELMAIVAKWASQQAPEKEVETAEAEAEPAPERGEDFDQATFDQMRGLFGDDKLQAYLNTVHTLLDKLKAGDADREALAASAHKLRSAAGMLGLMRISLLSGELEEACQAKDDVEALLNSLREAEAAAMERMRTARAA